MNDLVLYIFKVFIVVNILLCRDNSWNAYFVACFSTLINAWWFFDLMFLFVYSLLISHCFSVHCFMSSLFILDVNPFSDTWFANIFFILKFAFSFCWWYPLLCRSLFVWCNAIIFAFIAFAFVVKSKENQCQDQCQGAYCLCFFLGVLWFQVLCSNLFIYLFIWLHWGFSCGMWDLSFWQAGSSLQHAGFFLVVVRRLQSVWAQ